jgi:hypothetical protein
MSGISEKSRSIWNHFSVRTVFKTKRTLHGRLMKIDRLEMPSRQNNVFRYRHIIYTMYIYTYNPQSQPTILTLFLLILSLHVSVPTGDYSNILCILNSGRVHPVASVYDKTRQSCYLTRFDNALQREQLSASTLDRTAHYPVDRRW